MSLITDLLSKVKREEQKRDIPPGLRDSIIQSVEQKRSRNRIILPVTLAVVVMLTGAGLVYYITSYTTEVRPPASVAMQQPLPAQPAVSQPVPAALPAAQEATTQLQKDTTPGTTRETGKIESPVQAARTKKEKSHRVARAAKLPAEAVHETQKSRETNSGSNEQQVMQKRDRDDYIYSARSYEVQRDYPRALASYKKALDVDPNNFILMNNIAGVLIRMERYDEAIKYASNALLIRNNHVPSLVNLGIACSKAGKQTEGEGYFQRAISIDPTNRFALLNLGLLNEKRNSFDKGIEYFSKLAERSDSQGYLGLARIAEKQGKMANAVNYYKLALGTGNVDAKTKAMINNRLMQITLTP